MPTPATYFLIIFCFGALTLAAIYHSILYIHIRDITHRYYCFYLWAVALYIFYRFYFLNGIEPYIYYYYQYLGIRLAIDSNLMWVTFIFYISFISKAFTHLGHVNDRTSRFFSVIIYMIIINIVWENLAANILLGKWNLLIGYLIRIFLSAFAIWVIIAALQKRGLFYYYLAAGNMAVIFFSLVSVYVQMVAGKILFQINTWGWMMFGYFIDVIFFSAAIGYRLKEVSNERVAALNKIIDQQNEIKKLEIEKIQTAFSTRELERNRISTELHDDLGGGLSTIRLMTEMIKNPRFRMNGNYLENISQKVKELMQNMNEIVWSLNNDNDSFAGMIVYIRQYAASFLEDANIYLSSHQPAVVPLLDIDGHARRHIFLVVKEALHNIVKHSGAQEVKITISIDDDFIISITDNGKGIGSSSKNIPGNGMRNMQQRIGVLKGSFQILQQRGTTIIFSIPCSSLCNKSVS